MYRLSLVVKAWSPAGIKVFGSTGLRSEDARRSEVGKALVALV